MEQFPACQFVAPDVSIISEPLSTGCCTALETTLCQLLIRLPCVCIVMEYVWHVWLVFWLVQGKDDLNEFS